MYFISSPDSRISKPAFNNFSVTFIGGRKLTLVEIKPRNIIDRFNEYCNKLKHWQTYESEDLVQVKNR